MLIAGRRHENDINPSLIMTARARGAHCGLRTMAFLRRDCQIGTTLRTLPRSRPRMHDHRTRYRFCISNEQRLDVLCDPGKRAAIRLLSLFEFVEDADRGHGVVACID